MRNVTTTNAQHHHSAEISLPEASLSAGSDSLWRDNNSSLSCSDFGGGSRSNHQRRRMSIKLIGLHYNTITRIINIIFLCQLVATSLADSYSKYLKVKTVYKSQMPHDREINLSYILNLHKSLLKQAASLIMLICLCCC